MFYRDALGLPLVSRDYVTRFDLDGVLMELVPAPPGTVVPRNGNAACALRCRTSRKLWKRCTRAAFTPAVSKKKRDGRLAFFRDPDGNELSLRECPKNEDVLEIVPPAMFQ